MEGNEAKSNTNSAEEGWVKANISTNNKPTLETASKFIYETKLMFEKTMKMSYAVKKLKTI